MPARTLSFVLGLWEFFAAFAFPRPHPSFAAAWILGLLAAVLAAVAMARSWGRFATLALGIAVVLASFLAGERTLPWWNDVVAGAALALLSLVPGTLHEIPRRARVA